MRRLRGARANLLHGRSSPAMCRLIRHHLISSMRRLRSARANSLAWPVVAGAMCCIWQQDLCVDCAAQGGISCVAGRPRSQLPDLSVLAEKRYQTLHAGY